MSRIFDALQRAEGERSGVDCSSSAVTELLQLVERQAVSEWEIAARPDSTSPTETLGHDKALASPASRVRAELETAVATEPLSTHKDVDQLERFESRQISVTPQSQLVCFTDNESLAAEKFRFLGVRLRHLRREQALKKVLITSTIPHEGKSMVAANLACTLARKKEQRTLLLEGDVRRPSLSKMFGMDKIHGICEYLQGDDSEITNIYHFEDPGFWFLPAGNASGNPLEILQSGKLLALMDKLDKLFDWIIIDSPPVLPLADTSVWSRLADGILLVARQGTTEKRQLQNGIEALDHKKLIGALLNCSHSSAHNDYYSSYGPSGDARVNTGT